MDSDLQGIYQVVDSSESELADNAQNTWCWLYNTRDWTYFMHRFFDMRRNSELYSDMLDAYP